MIEKHVVSQDVYVVVQDGSMVEIWNELEGERRVGVGVNFNELGDLVRVLDKVQMDMFDTMIWNAYKVRFLLLVANQDSCKSMVESVLMKIHCITRETAHAIMNSIELNDDGWIARDGDSWKWTGKTPPSRENYPEIDQVLNNVA